MTAAIKYADQRAEVRHETYLKGQIKLDGLTIARCTIRNISSMGALLTFGDEPDVPDKFKLVIPDQTFETLCEVRHRTGNSIGVLFTSGRREALARFGSPFVM
jgi:methyl-accepting chemotaxis protein